VKDGDDSRGPWLLGVPAISTEGDPQQQPWEHLLAYLRFAFEFIFRHTFTK